MADLIFKAQAGLCQLCRREKRLEIDHIDNNPKNWAFENLRLLCHDCNIAERNRTQGYVKTEREKAADTPTEYRYSAGEPKKHDIMREEWDRWIRGRGRTSFPLYESLKKGEWAWFPASDITEAAPWGLGVERTLGSSESYWRFMKEDSSNSADIFERKIEKGELWIRYTALFIEVLNELNGNAR